MELKVGKKYFTNIDTQVLQEPGSMVMQVVDIKNGTELPVTVREVSDSKYTNGTTWYLTRGGKCMGHNRRIIFKLEGELQ